MKCPICGHESAGNECFVCSAPDVEYDERISQDTADAYQRVLAEAQQNLRNNLDGSFDYCAERGITKSAIRKWRLGYIDKFFPEDQLRILSPENPEICWGWKRRILFPIYSEDGSQIIAFSGRTIRKDREEKDIRKYFNSIYPKGKHVYGLSLISEGAADVFVCEGVPDAISVDSTGRKAVATLGVALTPTQAALLRARCSSVVLSYDADEAGRKAIIRAIPVLHGAGFKLSEISVLDISGGKDVDEAIRNGGTMRKRAALRYLAEHDADLAVSLCLREVSK